jgi:hypothetical protein
MELSFVVMFGLSPYPGIESNGFSHFLGTDCKGGEAVKSASGQRFYEADMKFTHVGNR